MIYTPMVKKAAQLAFRCHEGQTDKGGYPYVMHPLHLAEAMTDEDSCVVALLHDVVEDSQISLEELRGYGFSKVQVEAIDALTRRADQDYMTYILTQVKKNTIAVRVKLADLAHNMEESRIHEDSPESHARQEKYKKALDILSEEDQTVARK